MNKIKPIPYHNYVKEMALTVAVAIKAAVTTFSEHNDEDENAQKIMCIIIEVSTQKNSPQRTYIYSSIVKRRRTIAVLPVGC